MARQVSVVPHTHWDREWYEPFQTFRARLVALLDELLPRLEADPSYRHFMLDGQMAVVDDHLELRPEAADVLGRLAADGRVAMGPWYVLMDEFLVSGETIVRNLTAGRARAAAFGGAMDVGYLPDMFGHISQMPQILRQFGLDHAVVWRGTPSAVDRTGFWWRAPDGSTVRAEYLPEGYGNGAALPDDPGHLVDRIRQFDTAHETLIDGAPVLWMNGTDHQVPNPRLAEVVAAANAAQDDYELTITSLSSHVRAAPTEGLPSWTGELRSGARANLLMGVASNRVDVKQATARAERALERIAEPFAALLEHHRLAPWPAGELELAWRRLVLNSAHDSICACSVDEVCDAVRVRAAEAERLADAIVARGLSTLGATRPAGDVVVVNTSARDRSGLVEMEVPTPAEDAPADPGVQILEDVPARSLAHRVIRRHAPTVVEREIDIHLGVTEVRIDEAGDGTLDVTVVSDPPAGPGPALGWVRRELADRTQADPGGEVRVWLEQPARQRILVRTPPVPGLGWTTWSMPPAVAPVTISDDARTLANGRITVTVDPDDGTFALDGHRGLGRLVDDGDEGDTYNYSPPAEQQTVDHPEDVTIEAVESGPLRGRVAVRSTYRWPERIADGAREGSREVAVTTTLELRADESMVRVTTALDNPCRDHRLRVWLPLPHPTDRSEAECAFGTVERGLAAEGGDTEVGLPTFPSRRFVRAGGLTVAHEGLLEYELVDLRGPDGRPALAPGEVPTDLPEETQARALAVTLLRATGWLSRGPMAYRPLPAGPVVETPGAQVPGHHALRWAVAVGDVDPYAMVDDAFVPLLTARGDRGVGSSDERHGDAVGGEAAGAAGAEAGAGDRAGDVPSEARLVTITGAEVSAVLGGDSCRIRVFNPSDDPTTVTIDGRSGWIETLAGERVERFEGTVELPPWRIATLALDPD